MTVTFDAVWAEHGQGQDASFLDALCPVCHERLGAHPLRSEEADIGPPGSAQAVDWIRHRIVVVRMLGPIVPEVADKLEEVLTRTSEFLDNWEARND